jgi:hypothetical protein
MRLLPARTPGGGLHRSLLAPSCQVQPPPPPHHRPWSRLYVKALLVLVKNCLINEPNSINSFFPLSLSFRKNFFKALHNAHPLMQTLQADK